MFCQYVEEKYGKKYTYFFRPPWNRTCYSDTLRIKNTRMVETRLQIAHFRQQYVLSNTYRWEYVFRWMSILWNMYSLPAGKQKRNGRTPFLHYYIWYRIQPIAKLRKTKSSTRKPAAATGCGAQELTPLLLMSWIAHQSGAAEILQAKLGNCRNYIQPYPF